MTGDRRIRITFEFDVNDLVTDAALDVLERDALVQIEEPAEDFWDECVHADGRQPGTGPITVIRETRAIGRLR